MNVALSKETKIQISLGAIVALVLGFTVNTLSEIRSTLQLHTDTLEDLCVLVKTSIPETEANLEIRRKVSCDLVHDQTDRADPPAPGSNLSLKH